MDVPGGFGWAGYLYELGIGVPRDLGRAAYFYEIGAAGHLLAERSAIRLALRHGSLAATLAAIRRFVKMLIRAGVVA